MNGVTTRRLTHLEHAFRPTSQLENWEEMEARLEVGRSRERAQRFRAVADGFTATGDAILATMAPEDAWEVYDDFEQALDASVPGSLQSPLGRALFWICENVNPFWFPPVGPGKPYDRPLALPPVVCRVLRADPDTACHHVSPARSVFDCAECGYHVPQVSHAMLNRLRAAELHDYGDRSYFDACPLCGGLVAYDAYEITHGTKYHPLVREHLHPASNVETVCRFVFEQYPIH